MNKTTRQYFLQKLLKIPKEDMHVKISDLVFYNLTELLELLLDSTKDNDSDEFHSLLRIAIRFYRKDKGKLKEYISLRLSENKFWSEKMRWEAYFFYIGNMHYQNIMDKKLKENKQKRQNTIFKRYFWNNLELEQEMENRDKKSIKKNLDNIKIYTNSLKEMNYYLIHLNVDMELAASWIISLGKRLFQVIVSNYYLEHKSAIK
jgi:hypothetical protein